MDIIESRFSTAVRDEPVSVWLCLLLLLPPPPLWSYELEDTLSGLRLLLLAFTGLSDSRGGVLRNNGGVARRETVMSVDEVDWDDDDDDRFRLCLLDLDDEDATELPNEPLDNRAERWSKARIVSIRDACDKDTSEL